MDDFVVSGSDSDSDAVKSFSSKKKGRSKSYRDDSWDSDVTSDESYTKRRPKKKSKSARPQKSKKSKKAKYKRYSDDSDVEFESTSVSKKNILDEDNDVEGPRRTRGKRKNYNVILDDSSESETEKAKSAGKQIENCIDSTEEEYDVKDDDDISEDDPDEYIDDEDTKDKSDDDSGDIDNQVQINNERTQTQT